ncbi:hypothetical protein TNCT_430041 [Trichonephila clavata]|uniref:Uncharacterized protein n=1 Tax=Trichonephila clavata TaxID=2740835 RepID=A0A8X6JFA9_TRICU|nr:hypothetical protein TNCT_430041 [Trichonephila clavata]
MVLYTHSNKFHPWTNLNSSLSSKRDSFGGPNNNNDGRKSGVNDTRQMLQKLDPGVPRKPSFTFDGSSGRSPGASVTSRQTALNGSSRFDI